MRLTWQSLTLQLRTPFRIAHGVSDQRHNVLVRLEHEGLVGLGEAPAVPYYQETPADICAYLESAAAALSGDPEHLDAVLGSLPPGSRAGRCAIDVALHDLWGQRLGQPLYRLFGLDPRRLPLTSFTIAMDAPAVMAQQARQSGYPLLKIKLGSPDDESIIAAIRQATGARLRVDANAGWTPQQALELIPRLARYDLELVEQPLPAADHAGLRWLRQELRQRGVALPIYADESAQTSSDVAALAGAIDGVVVKLMKTGGLREALCTIHTARAHGLGVMLSCMVESSLNVTAAAHLASLCDYVDLDGPLLIANDPFTGLAYDGARLTLPSTPGLGVRLRA
jgi:L-alanine-DL-glutamate epimerase-like enolase superfamily enzyme